MENTNYVDSQKPAQNTKLYQLLNSKKKTPIVDMKKKDESDEIKTTTEAPRMNILKKLQLRKEAKKMSESEIPQQKTTLPRGIVLADRLPPESKSPDDDNRTRKTVSTSISKANFLQGRVSTRRAPETTSVGTLTANAEVIDQKPKKKEYQKVKASFLVDDRVHKTKFPITGFSNDYTSFYVNVRSNLYNLIKSMDFELGVVDGKRTMLPKNRNRSLNAILCFSVLNDGIDYYNEVEGYITDPEDIQTYKVYDLNGYENYLVRSLGENCKVMILDMCLHLLVRMRLFTQYNIMIVEKIIESMNVHQIIEKYLVDCTENPKIRFPFEELFSKYVFEDDEYFQSDENEIKFEKMILSKMATYDENIQIENSDRALLPKMLVGGKYVLEELISGVEGQNIEIGNSQVWKASNAFKKCAIKFISIDYFMDEDMENAMGKTKNGYNPKKYSEKKILDLVKANHQDYVNRSKIPQYPYASNYKEVGYDSRARACYLVMEFYEEGNLFECRDKLIQKTEAILNILNVLYELHNLGYSFDNLNPAHIMLRYNSKNEEEFHLVDFARMTTFGETSEMSPSVHGFASHNSLLGGVQYPHDDIESLLYVADYLLSGNIQEFSSTEDEIEQKESLECYSDGIRELIMKLRDQRQNDVNDLEDVEFDSTNSGEFVSAVYEQFVDDLAEFLSNFKEVRKIAGADLHKSEERVVDAIMNDMVTYAAFQDMDIDTLQTMALKIKNCVLYGCKYPLQEQMIIDEFLSDKKA